MPGLRLIEGAAFNPEPRGSWALRTNKPALISTRATLRSGSLWPGESLKAARPGERNPAKRASYGIEGRTEARPTSDTG